MIFKYFAHGHLSIIAFVIIVIRHHSCIIHAPTQKTPRLCNIMGPFGENSDLALSDLASSGAWATNKMKNSSL